MEQTTPHSDDNLKNEVLKAIRDEAARQAAGPGGGAAKFHKQHIYTKVKPGGSYTRISKYTKD